MDYLKLIEPLNKRVKEIQESLYHRKLLEAGEEKMIYGTFETSYRNFYTENLRNGKSVNEVDYFNDRINELNTIEKNVISLEKKLEHFKFHAILSNILSIKEFSNKLIIDCNSTKSQEKSKPKRLKNKRTYKWLPPYQEINSLYVRLKKENLISKATKYSDFEFIFKEKNITEISQPIVWASSNATELLFFILLLIENKIIDGNNNRMDYQLLKECFVDNENNKFKDSFKSLKTDIYIKLSANKQSIIQNIVQKMNN